MSDMMEVTIDGEVVRIDNAKLVLVDFSGMKNRYGNAREFGVKIDDETAARKLRELGFNVKSWADMTFIKVKVGGKHFPTIYIRDGEENRMLSPNEFGRIDNMRIDRADLDIRPYDWNVNGNTGRSAYLDTMLIYPHADRFGRL